MAYHDDLKRSATWCPAGSIVAHGSVSAEAAEAMARGVRSRPALIWAWPTTGIAGPGGATLSKPVGLAWLAITDSQRTIAREHHWAGDRAANRAASARAILDLTLAIPAIIMPTTEQMF